MDPNGMNNENCERRLYIGNIDHRISEAMLIKMFSPYGKIESEDFLLHTRGLKRGEPRGFAFIQFTTKEEAILAREKMHGRLACGRPLVVRLTSEKCQADNNADGAPAGVIGDANKPGSSSGVSLSSSRRMNRSAKIAAIKNKLRSLEPEENDRAKKLKQTSGV